MTAAEEKIRTASFDLFDLPPLAFSGERDLNGKGYLDWKFVSTAPVEASFYDERTVECECGMFEGEEFFRLMDWRQYIFWEVENPFHNVRAY